MGTLTCGAPMPTCAVRGARGGFFFVSQQAARRNERTRGEGGETHLDERAAVLRDEDAGLDGDLRAARLDDEVDRGRAALRDAELVHHRARVARRVRLARLAVLHRRGHVRVRRGVRLGERVAARDDVDGDDARRAERARDGHAEQPDGARAEDDDGLVRAELGDVGDRVDRDREGLHLRVWVGGVIADRTERRMGRAVPSRHPQV